MNDRTYRGLMVAGLCANVLFLALAALDWTTNSSNAAWPLFITWAFVVLLMGFIAIFGSNLRIVRVASTETRIVERAAPEAKKAPAPVAFTESNPADFPFIYNGFTLYGRDVELKNGGTRPIFYFAKNKPVSGKMVPKPAHMHVGVNERTGLPFLKKGDAADGEDLTPNIVAAYRPQCSALTEEGHQCRNSSRQTSKYCGSHFGYQPPTIAKAAAAREDTLPRVAEAKDTTPSVRKRSVA